MRVSYSALNSFLTCPAKYKFSEIDKIKTSKSKEAIFGMLIHSALRIIHDTKRLIPPAEEEVLKFFSNSWNKEIYESEAEEAVAFEQGVRILKEYYAKNYPTKFRVIDLESYFDAPIEDGKEIHQITGIIDRIDKLKDDSMEIIDYKTSRSLPSQKSVDENLQLAVYHLGILKRWPMLAARPIKLSLYFVKHGEKLSTIKTNKDVEKTKEKILEIIDKIKKSDFAPVPNNLCDWCDFQARCPYFSHKFNPLAGGEKIDGKKIKAAIDEYFKIKENSKKEAAKIIELAELINQYCDEQKVERVFSESGYISRLPQERISYNSEKITALLKSLGKLEEFLAVDIKKFAKNIDKFTREEKKKIEELQIKKKYKTLNAKKKE